MEQLASGNPPALQRGSQPSASCSVCGSFSTSRGNGPTSYLYTRWAARRRDGSQDGATWESVAHIASKLTTLEQRIEIQSAFPSHDIAAAALKSEKLEAQLRRLEEALDKLLSSFSGVVVDPVDPVHSTSMCVAGSRATVESVSHLLALYPYLEDTNKGLCQFQSSARDAADVLCDGDALSSTCSVRVSEQLSGLEDQLSTLESLVAALRVASHESNALLHTVSNMYASMS